MTEMTKSGNQQSGEPQESANHPSATPWGFWGTAGLGLVVALAFLLIQGFVSGFFAASIMQAQPDIAQEDLMKQLEGNGLAIAVATCATGVLCTALVLLLARIRRGISVREYLALRFPPLRSLLVWLGVGLGVAAASEGLLLLLGEESVPEFMISAYQTAVYLPLFWVALVVAAPLFEEIFFRGFLFQGWSQSKLREGRRDHSDRCAFQRHAHSIRRCPAVCSVRLRRCSRLGSPKNWLPGSSLGNARRD